MQSRSASRPRTGRSRWHIVRSTGRGTGCRAGLSSLLPSFSLFSLSLSLSLSLSPSLSASLWPNDIDINVMPSFPLRARACVRACVYVSECVCVYVCVCVCVCVCRATSLCTHRVLRYSILCVSGESVWSEDAVLPRRRSQLLQEPVECYPCKCGTESIVGLLCRISIYRYFANVS